MAETKVIIKTAHGTITLYPESIELLGAKRYPDILPRLKPWGSSVELPMPRLRAVSEQPRHRGCTSVPS